MRYFLEFAYNGTRFHGYQIQPNGITVQETIEQALSTILKEEIKITGCGRTDTGVHAAHYFAHFDSEHELFDNLIYRLNGFIGPDIAFSRLIPVHADAHARFDATSRSYKYVIDLHKNPFGQESAYYCKFGKRLDIQRMQVAAELLLQYQDFTTFCKTNTDTKTNLCTLTKSYWEYDEEKQQLIYHISANRFLRGMIRLIVGMCLNIGQGKLDLATVQYALEKKQTLTKALSAPARGLYLLDIRYAYIS